MSTSSSTPEIALSVEDLTKQFEHLIDSGKRLYTRANIAEASEQLKKFNQGHGAHADLRSINQIKYGPPYLLV